MKKLSTLLGWLIALSLPFGSVALQAQSTGQQADSTAAGASQDEPVQMSQFIVRTTEGMGYVDANSASGFKTSQSLLDIPQTELVLTQDLIKDIGVPSRYPTDLLVYGGVATWFRGGTGGSMIRGSRANASLSDGFASAAYWNQDFIDSMEVLKGTVAVLYQGSAVTGTVIMSTKKPLPNPQTIVSVEGTTLGGLNGMFDSTGPIGQWGDIKLNYRLIAGYQSNGNWFTGDNFSVRDVHPSLEMDYKNTIVLLAFGLEHIEGTWNGNGVLTPTGDLYTGAGYRNAGRFFPGMDLVNGLHRDLRTTFIQKISDSWENKLSAIYWTEYNYGGNAVNTSENWQTGIIGGIFRENNEPINTTQILDDVTGKYRIGFFPAQSTFGFAHFEKDDTSKFWTTVNDGPNTFAVPAADAALINSIHVPQQSAGEYSVPANPGSRVLTYSELVYAEEQIDLVPKWFSVVGGWAYFKSEVITDTDIITNTPYVSTDTGYHAWFPRWGMILHVTKDVSLFALDSQSAAVNSFVDINNNRLPNIQISSKEVGAKSALWNGRIVVDFSVFRIIQSNQGVFSGLVNAEGVGYYDNVGTTTNEGWDMSAALALLPGWQVIATGYDGTVKNQANVWVAPGFGNMITFYTRYDLPKDSFLRNVAVGGGLSRIGSRYISTGGMTFPVGWASPAYFKMHEGTAAMTFIDYRFNKHFTAHLSCNNVLNQQYPMGSQSAGVIDPAEPRDFQLSLTASF